MLSLVFAFVTSPATGDSDFTQNLDAALTTILKESGTVGFAVGVIKPGEEDYLKGYGVTKLGTNNPITKTHVFHWASVSKPFVAIAIMQLVEQEKLSLDTRLVDALPEYKVTDPRHELITIKQLLLHTSGLPDVWDYQWRKPQEDDEALHRWATKESPRRLRSDPGTKREYSNVGFEVLGAVIAKVSGMTFEDYMMKNIFESAGMGATTFYFPDVPQESRTHGHKGKSGKKKQTANYPWNRRHGPSSTLNTSVAEMALFAHVLMESETLLQASTLDEMWAANWPLDEAGEKAATLGWVRETRDGIVMVRHFGGDVGFRSMLALMPEIGAAVFLVANDEDVPLGPIALAALEALSEPPSSTP